MTRALFVVLLAVAAVISGCTHRPATWPSTWQLYGVVVSVENGTFTVRHKSGHVVTLNIDARTVFLKEKEPASLQSLLHWSRVVVDVETGEDGTRYARSVRISGGGEPW